MIVVFSGLAMFQRSTSAKRERETERERETNKQTSKQTNKQTQLSKLSI
jgi:hypothetical protein